MDKENVTKLDILHGYDDYLDSLNRKLDYISDQLYGGDTHSIEELTDLVLDIEEVLKQGTKNEEEKFELIGTPNNYLYNIHKYSLP